MLRAIWTIGGDVMSLQQGEQTESARTPLEDVMRKLTSPADEHLIQPQADGSVRCLACGHRCLVRPGKAGVCKVRFNQDGVLRVPFGYVSGVACDPIEKKPFFHMLPGSDIVTFGMLGCDLHCSYCQNWISSQVLRDAEAASQIQRCEAEDIVRIAADHGLCAIASSYNEPLITSEWAVAIFRIAKQRGMRCAYVSNGNATPEVLDFLRPWVDAYKIDLKSFDDRHYRELGTVLDNITTGIRMAKERGFWVEIVTLLVPGFNDSPEELHRMADFLVSVDPLMPWHITAFHPDYKMATTRATRVSDLLAAADIGVKAGMKYIYLGNLTGRLEGWEDTRCHQCASTLIRRHDFAVHDVRVTSKGTCPDCAAAIPGIWS